MNGVDEPPANPTSLGNVWIGTTRPAIDTVADELQRLRAMHAALLRLASDHAPECCSYCKHVREHLDAVLALGPTPSTSGPLEPKCARWP